MEYAIKSTSISGISLSEDNLSANFNITILYNTKEESKLQDSSVGCTISISLKKGERSTMVDELDKGVQDWFNTNYNPK